MYTLAGAGVWTIMRGSAPQGETPQCVVDIDFVHEEHSRELWAATVVQHAWNGWRERMAMLLLLYDFAELDGEPETLCVPSTLCNPTTCHILYHSRSGTTLTEQYPLRRGGGDRNTWSRPSNLAVSGVEVRHGTLAVASCGGAASRWPRWHGGCDLAGTLGSRVLDGPRTPAACSPRLLP